MAVADDTPPRREVGSNVASGGQVAWPGLGNRLRGWSAFAVEGERVPELKGRDEIRTYDEMLTNPQIWALFMGMMLPLLEYDFGIEPGDADPAMTQILADDLGLPVGLPAPGDKAPPLGPGAFRFNFLEHLWEALFAPAYGRYYFEQVGEVIPDDGLWHLRRLAPRPPHDVSDVITDDDGGLTAILYPGVETNATGMRLIRDVPIPVSQLVAYVWLPTAKRRWVGRSMLRACFEPWLVRSRLVPVDAINHERAGGVPGIETDETWQGGDLTELQQLASAFRVGETSGSALPPGAHLKIARVGGTDVVASMRYHDESMARAWGAMVRQLGQTMTGSRALGTTFADLEAVVRRSIMRWFAATFREHVIEDWWRWNVGPTPHPSLAWRDSQDPAIGIPDPKDPNAPGLGVNEDVSPPNPQPPRSASPLAGGRGDARHDTARVRGAVDREGARGRGGVVRAASRLPDRPLRRQPYEHEIRAAVDFAAMDTLYETGVIDTEGLLANLWLPQLHQAAEDAITFTKAGKVRQRLTRLNASQITLAAPDAEPLATILLNAARESSAGAVAELASQGMAVTPLTDAELGALVSDQAQAVAQLVADGVRLAASRRAVQMNAGRTPGEVASAVTDYLSGLVHAWERDQLRGAVQAATNAARLQVFALVPADQPAYWYSSEILDVATCGPCREIDGREFESITEAQRFYPFGGFADCLGGPRCRGTVVAVMAESAPTVFPAGLGPG